MHSQNKIWINIHFKAHLQMFDVRDYNKKYIKNKHVYN